MNTSQPAASTEDDRVRLRHPISNAGYIDAAWWPRTADLATELPALLDTVWSAGRQINRVTYNLDAWKPAPLRLHTQGRTVRLGGFATSDPQTVRLTDAWGIERIDVLVITPSTAPALADRILRLVGDGSLDRAQDILNRANTPPRLSPSTSTDHRLASTPGGRIGPRADSFT